MTPQTNDPLHVEAVSKSFAGTTALLGVDLAVQPRKITAVIGPNGAGKTTLFNIITGFTAPDTGRVLFRGKDIVRLPPHKIARLGTARTSQDVRLIRQMSAYENVLLASTPPACDGLGHRLLRAHQYRSEKMASVRASECLDAVSLADRASELAGNLSFGQQELLTIACCLATGAGVSPSFAECLLTTIQRPPEIGKTVIMIEHNMVAVKACSDLVVVMDRGQTVACGTWGGISASDEFLEAFLR
jgi:ABC-type branched-subunit amino acid transport system ATPase component